MKLFYLVDAVLLLSLFSHADGVCQDLDPNACVLMHNKDPHLCQNVALAEAACPKFCNLCPLTCYHCDTITSSLADCKLLKVCEPRQECMLATFLSADDGHYEYKMNCAIHDSCEGRQFLTLFGRRGIKARSVTTSCCSENLCNNPFYHQPATAAATTTPSTTTASIATPSPTCTRDIEFLVQDFMSGSRNEEDIRSFLRSVTSKMTIGPNDNMVGLITFDIHERLRTGVLSNTTALAHYIDNLSLSHGRPDVDLHRVLNDVIRGGDFSNGRNDIKNVAVFIFNTDVLNHSRDHLQQSDLNGIDDVIVVGVGAGNLPTEFQVIATDVQHVLHVNSFDQLSSLQYQILSLIC